MRPSSTHGRIIVSPLPIVPTSVRVPSSKACSMNAGVHAVNAFFRTPPHGDRAQLAVLRLAGGAIARRDRNAHIRRMDRPVADSTRTPQLKRWVLAATILGSSMAFIDGSVVSVA